MGELQTEINNLISSEAKGIDIVNGKYDEQLQKLKDIKEEKYQALENQM